MFVALWQILPHFQTHGITVITTALLSSQQLPQYQTGDCYYSGNSILVALGAATHSSNDDTFKRNWSQM